MLDTWYRYYAGYSAQFVEHVLRELPTDGGPVLDAWNGTGTTTVMAARAGREAVGYDVNPALVVVAKARLLGNSVAGSISALTDDVVGHASPAALPGDPLLSWFREPEAEQLRGLQLSAHRLLVGAGDVATPPIASVDRMSSLAAFFYVALFRAARLLAAPYSGTNPTWWRAPQPDARVSPGGEAVIAAFRAAAVELLGGLHGARFDAAVPVSVSVADSKRLPLGDGAAAAALSSPPYCTRIDYAVATRPELAVLRADEATVRSLRDAMVGTPTITRRRGDRGSWGPAASAFLAEVDKHPSRASSSYYLPYFEQYYAAMWDSLNELRRVCRAGGTAVLVVQDSHYKDVHNDTPGILLEMAALAGFLHGRRHDFPLSRTKAAMNPRARAHRASASAVESVLVLS